MFLAAMCIFAGIFAAQKAHGGNSRWNRLFFKAAASVMFVLVAVAARLDAEKVYYILILIGLVCSLIGNVLLVITDKGIGYLVSSAVFYALTYGLYIAGFGVAGGFSYIDIPAFLAFVVIASSVFYSRAAKLNGLRIPALVYTLVLCAMAAKAVTLPFLMNGRIVFAIVAAAGGVLIAVSQLLVAMARMPGKHETAMRVWNVVTSFAGQGLIALSVMM